MELYIKHSGFTEYLKSIYSEHQTFLFCFVLRCSFAVLPKQVFRTQVSLTLLPRRCWDYRHVLAVPSWMLGKEWHQGCSKIAFVLFQFLFVVILFVWDKLSFMQPWIPWYSLYSWDWPWTPASPHFTCQVLGLQTCYRTSFWGTGVLRNEGKWTKKMQQFFI